MAELPLNEQIDELQAALGEMAEIFASRIRAMEEQLQELEETIGDLPMPDPCPDPDPNPDPDPDPDPDPYPDPDPDPDPDPPPPDPIGGGIPTAKREVPIKRGGELQEALASDLEPGTHLVLQPGGDYAGSYTLKKPGTAEDPIYIRGTEAAPVRFSGKIYQRAQFTGIGWLEFTGNETKVDIGARFSRVTRCLFDKVSAAAVIYLSGSQGHGQSSIDYCDFIDIRGPALRSELQGDPDGHRGSQFAYNHVNGHTVYGGNEAVAMVQSSEFKDINLDFLYCLFENCLKGATNQRELISLKTSGGRVKGCTFRASNRGFVSSRHSCRYIMEDNWFQDGCYINAYGDDVVIRNCRSDGVLVKAQRGSAYSGTAIPKGCNGAPKSGKVTINRECKPAHCGARRLVVENSVGAIELGDRKSSKELGTAVPCEIMLTNNASKAKRFAGCDSITESGIGNDACTAQELRASDVGRDAPS